MSSCLLFVIFFLPYGQCSKWNICRHEMCLKLLQMRESKRKLPSVDHRIQGRGINSYLIQAVAVFKGFDPKCEVQLQGHLGNTFLVCGQVIGQGGFSEWASGRHWKLTSDPTWKEWTETSRGSQPPTNLVNICGQALLWGWKWNEDQVLGSQTVTHSGMDLANKVSPNSPRNGSNQGFSDAVLLEWRSSEYNILQELGGVDLQETDLFHLHQSRAELDRGRKRQSANGSSVSRSVFLFWTFCPLKTYCSELKIILQR